MAVAVTVLPEHLKSEERWQPYATPAMHVLSGLAECFLCAVAFIVGLISYVSSFARTSGWTYLAHQPTLGYGDFFAVGALGYVSYFVQPLSLLLLYLYAEGAVRAFEAAFSGRMLGLGLVSLGWRVSAALSRRAERARIAALLGPPRPDEVIAPADSRSGMLEIYSVEDKPWSAMQVVEWREQFFILATRELGRRGKWYAYRYQLHPLEEREVIRGSIARLTTGEEETGLGARGSGPPSPTP